jgi:3-oxoadipate enol-lactonase
LRVLGGGGQCRGLHTRQIDIGPFELAVLEAGAGGRPLLLVHGFTGAKEDFADHVEDLVGLGWHVVSPDLRGHGESHHPPDGYSLGTMAEDLLALVDALGWGPFVLVGHSMGGVLAQLLALAHPGRVEALVLMDTTGAAAAIDPGLVELACEVVATGGMPALLEAQKLIGNPLDSEFIASLRQTRPGFDAYADGKLLASAPAMYLAMSRAMIEAPSRLAELAGLSMPTLVMVGERDDTFFPDAAVLAEAIPGAQLVVIPQAGHSPQHENPTAFSAALTAFLATV